METNTGVFVGTSLHGLGKKYTIIDYLEKEDIAELINILKISFLKI
jgi:hypothetical protein